MCNHYKTIFQTSQYCYVFVQDDKRGRSSFTQCDRILSGNEVNIARSVTCFLIQNYQSFNINLSLLC